MASIRHLLKVHPRLLALLLLVALAVKVLVPSGYMIAPDTKIFTVQICTGMGMMEKTIEIPVDQGSPDTGKHHGSDDASTKPCSFAGFAQLGLNIIDPVLLTIALAFILLAGLQLQSVPEPRAVLRLRPPLRGPPFTA